MKRFTPKIALMTLVALLALVLVVIISNKKSPQNLNSENDSPTLAANAEVSTEPSLSDFYGSADPASKTVQMSEYIYPSSKVKTQTASQLVLESDAPAESITIWYKDLIKSLNFNAKSFTQTNTNGAILNKLSSAKPGEKLEITIKKDQNESKVTITVDRS